MIEHFATHHETYAVCKKNSWVAELKKCYTNLHYDILFKTMLTITEIIGSVFRTTFVFFLASDFSQIHFLKFRFFND